MLVLAGCGAAGPVGQVDVPDGSWSVDTASDSPADSPDSVDTSPKVDRDGDGYGEGDDCDDDNPYVHPDATELCDAVDQDCDGDNLAPGVCGESNYITGMIIPVSHITDLNWDCGVRIVKDLTGDGRPDLLGGPSFESEEGDKLDAIWDGAAIPDSAPEFPDGTAALIVDPAGYQDSYARLSPGDLDGDGAPDAAFFDECCATLYVFKGPLAQDHRLEFSEADYVWTIDRPVTWYGGPEGALGDLDADGRDDLAFHGESSSDSSPGAWVDIVFGTDAAVAEHATVWKDGYDGMLVPIRDVDGDGIDEMVYVSAQATVVDTTQVRPGASIELSDITEWEWEGSNDNSKIASDTQTGTTSDWDDDGYPEIYIGQDYVHEGEGSGAVYFFQAPFDTIASYDDAIGTLAADADMSGLAEAIWQIDDANTGDVLALVVYGGLDGPVLVRDKLPAGVQSVSEVDHVAYDRGPRQPTGFAGGYGEDIDNDGITDLSGGDYDVGIVGYIPGFIPPWDDPLYW